MEDLQMINGSWSQTIAYLLNDYIVKSDLEKYEISNLIERILNDNKDQILLEIKKEPIKQIEVELITKYINTETTKFIYVDKPEKVVPDKVVVQELSYDPRSEWQTYGNGWEIKTDSFNRKYYRTIGNKARVLRESEFISFTKPVRPEPSIRSQQYDNIPASNEIWRS